MAWAASHAAAVVVTPYLLGGNKHMSGLFKLAISMQPKSSTATLFLYQKLLRALFRHI